MREAGNKISRLVLKARNKIREYQVRLGIPDFTSPHLSQQKWSEIFHSELGGKFFLPVDSKDDLPGQFSKEYPDQKAEILLEADLACSHIFNLLGSGPTDLGRVIDWHTDFKSGYRWDPSVYYKKHLQAPYPGGYDIKIPWELSRCQHFVRLGQAYWFTADERYTREFRDQFSDWLDKNPWPYGVNWSCAMDVAIRVVNWLWAYFFFIDSPSLNTQFHQTFFNSLLQHGHHIYKNLENTGPFNTNHYLANLAGLLYLGVLLPDCKHTRAWRNFALKELESELFKQTGSDGAFFENSTSYHRLSLEMCLSATTLARRNAYQFSDQYMQRLEKAIEFTYNLTTPQGMIPLIGDCDNGRLHRLKVWQKPEEEWSDHRYLLAIGALLYNRQDFAQAAGDQWEEAFWLWGTGAILQHNHLMENPQPLQLTSYAYPQAGITILRNEDQYMLIDATCNGQNGLGGHDHNDALSFELHSSGLAWIVDPGTYTYSADYEARNFFRSTASHNSIQVDGQEINPFKHDKLWEMAGDAQVVVESWHTSSAMDSFQASHAGYLRLKDPVLHRRKFQADKQARSWVIEDQIEAHTRHQYILRLHCAEAVIPDILPAPEKGLAARLKAAGGKTLSLEFYLGGSAEKIQLSVAGYDFSPCYGVKRPAQMIVLSWEATGNTRLSTKISEHLESLDS